MPLPKRTWKLWDVITKEYMFQIIITPTHGTANTAISSTVQALTDFTLCDTASITAITVRLITSKTEYLKIIYCNIVQFSGNPCNVTMLWTGAPRCSNPQRFAILSIIGKCAAANIIAAVTAQIAPRTAISCFRPCFVDDISATVLLSEENTGAKTTAIKMN